ncbi:hypothetical protein E2562_022541 [Oryza meyeriana var. granulata]|uniref:Uncharacterized protein n=1 Tax=Oryza meyeriana var. granulata TaxID=110450 RepID=A0A6G1FAT0_9ORYZ|nr:hypothetical protein E2562_022541 [Oryza meyeriana var. granulata]
MLPPILLSCADSDSPCTPAEEGASLHIQWPTKEGTGPPDLAADGGLHQAPDPVADGGGPSWWRASHSLGHLHRRCISLPQAVSTSASVGPTHPPCQPPPSSTCSSPSSTCFPHTEDDALDLLLDELDKEPFQSSILDWDEVRRVVALPKHEAFMIGTMMNPNNKGFDIFITTAPIPDLNDKLVVFEPVINGENIVQGLARRSSWWKHQHRSTT